MQLNSNVAGQAICADSRRPFTAESPPSPRTTEWTVIRHVLLNGATVAESGPTPERGWFGSVAEGPRPPCPCQDTCSSCCYLGIVRPRATIPLSLRCRSSLSKVSRISLSTAVSGSSGGLRYASSSRPESSELGDMVEESGGCFGTGGWISLRKKMRQTLRVKIDVYANCKLQLEDGSFRRCSSTNLAWCNSDLIMK